MKFERDKSLMPNPVFNKDWPQDENGHTWHQYYTSSSCICLKCGQDKNEKDLKKCQEQQDINNSHDWPISGPYAEDLAICKVCGLVGIRGGMVPGTNYDIVYTVKKCTREIPEEWYEVLKKWKSLGSF